MTSATGALYATLFAYLRTYGGVWGERVEPLAVATVHLAKPCLQFFHAGGANVQSVPINDSKRILLTVKVVAESMQTAVDGQGQISLALKDSGEQDVNPRLGSNLAWHISTVTEIEEIWEEEMWEETQRIYHAGYQYEFLLEKR